MDSSAVLDGTTGHDVDAAKPRAPIKPDQWSEPERWVWQQVSQGEIADFHARYGRIDPRRSEDWTEQRLLRPAFLETLLLHDPHRNALPRQGVRIRGAWIAEVVDLENASLAHAWWLDASRVDAPVRLSRLESTDMISFEDSVFKENFSADLLRADAVLVLSGAEFKQLDLGGADVRGPVWIDRVKCADMLNMNGLKVVQHLFMRNGAQFADVDLSNAEIGGQLSLSGAKCTGKLNMNGLNVNQQLFMSRDAVFGDPEFAEVTLVAAKVGGQLLLDGAKCSGEINMNGLKVEQHLFMRKGAQFVDAKLPNAEVRGQLSLSGAKCTGKLDMSGLKVGQHLFMSQHEELGDPEFADVMLVAAHVGDQLSLDGAKCSGQINMSGLKVGSTLSFNGAKCAGKIDMNGVDVGQNLFMRQGAQLTDVDLTSAEVRNQLSLSGATVTGMLDMNGVKVGQSLFMSQHADFGDPEFHDVKLVAAKIGGQLSLEGAKCTGALDMERLDLATDLFMRAMHRGPAAQDPSELSLTLARIGGNVYLSGSTLGVVNLAGASIKGELELGVYGAPTWQARSRLILRGADIGSIGCQFAADALPADLDLNDLTYARLNGLRDGTTGTESRRGLAYWLGLGRAHRDIDTNVAWLIDHWLGRDRRFSRQPYQQLARILLNMGEVASANEVLYAGQERERLEAAKGLRRLGLTFLKYTIGYGYGYRYFLSLAWVGLFTAFGAAVFATTPNAGSYTAGQWIVIGISQLLPIIELDKELLKKALEAMSPGSWQQYSFYFLKVVGYVLGGFVVAGLAGLTKK